MKAKLNLVTAIAVALICFCACQNLENNPSPYADYANVNGNFDISKFINNNTVTTKAGETVTMNFGVNFTTRIEKDADNYDVKNYGESLGGAITLVTTQKFSEFKLAEGLPYSENPYGNIPGYEKGKVLYNVTTDRTIYVYETRKSCVEDVFGTFKYPVRIRQIGTDGTYYITAEQLRKWKTSPTAALSEMLDENQRYVKGTVTSVGNLYTEMKSSGPSGLWTAPWAIENKQVVSRLFDVMDINVNVDGEELPVRIEYMSDYRMFENLSLKAGDTVEINFRDAGAKAEIGRFYASPVDVFVK